MALKLTWPILFQKVIGGIFVGMIGVALGFFVGGIFTDMGILTQLPWQELLVFLGGLIGFLFGTQIE